MISAGITASMQDPNPWRNYDNFTDPNTTQITSHNMDKGGSWSIVGVTGTPPTAASNITIQNNTLRFAVNNTAIIFPGVPDSDMTVDWTPRGGGDDRNSIITNYTDANNFTFVNFRRGTLNDLSVVEYVAGVATILSGGGVVTPFVWNVNQTYKIGFTKNINLIGVTVDGSGTGITANVSTFNNFQGLMRNAGNSLSEFDNLRHKGLLDP